MTEPARTERRPINDPTTTTKNQGHSRFTTMSTPRAAISTTYQPDIAITDTRTLRRTNVVCFEPCGTDAGRVSAPARNVLGVGRLTPPSGCPGRRSVLRRSRAPGLQPVVGDALPRPDVLDVAVDRPLGRCVH
jgi:hypothetical protein